MVETCQYLGCREIPISPVKRQPHVLNKPFPPPRAFYTRALAPAQSEDPSSGALSQKNKDRPSCSLAFERMQPPPAPLAARGAAPHRQPTPPRGGRPRLPGPFKCRARAASAPRVPGAQGRPIRASPPAGVT